jgi:hypothetical protein
MVRREVTVRPSQLLFYQNGSEMPARTIVISDMRPKPFRVTGGTCKSPLVKVKVGQPVDDPDSGRETTVIISVAAQAPKEDVRTAVMLSTDDPRYPRIPIPIWIRDMHASTIQQTSGKSSPAVLH